MHTISEIINNQTKFEKAIKESLIKDLKDCKKNLKDIKTKDAFIKKEKEKLIKKFKNLDLNKHVNKLFFLSRNRYSDYYVWWSEESNEPIILKYD